MARIETLFRRYRDRGDVRALGRVFDRTADETLRVAMYFARDPAQAEEWLQQAYLLVIERADSWDDSRRFLPWLLGILRNVVRRAQAERKQAGLPESPLPAPRARDTAEDTEWTAAVAEAVDALADPYRAVLILRLQHGLAPAEIARLQRVPVATIRSQIHRGLVQLRTSLPRAHRPLPMAALSLPIGLVAIRTNVLTAASTSTSTATTAAGVASSSLLGGLAMQKVALIALAVAALAFAALDPLGLRSGESDDGTPAAPSAPVEEGRATGPQLEPREPSPDDHARTPATAAGPDVDLEIADRAQDLHGTVVLSNGQPVVGANVRLEGTPWRSLMINDVNNPETRELGSTTTGPRGTFVLRLRAGVCGLLRVTAPGHAARQVWSVAAGERVRVVLDRAVSLVVRVKAPDGAPASGVSIRVTGAGAGLGPRAPARATTDMHGIARVDGLDPGGSLMVGAAPQREGWGLSDLARVTLPATGSHEHEIQLPTGRTIRGLVTDAATGVPIPGARVGMGWGRDPSVRTDEKGAYVLHGWTGEGIREITAGAPGYVRGRKSVGRAEDALDFALTVGATLRGRVVDASGAPISMARVAVVGSMHVGRVQRLSLANGWTDAEGGFALDGLSPEIPLSINVRADGHARRIVDIDAVAGNEQDVGDIVLAAPLTVSGTVLRHDGTPAARIPVRITGANADRAVRRASKKPANRSYGTRQDVTTDDLGRFVINDLCAGEFRLSCKARAPLVETSLSLDGSVPRTEVKLQLPSTRTIRVQVLDAEGTPVTRAIVGAVHQRRRISGRVDTLGRVLLEIPEDVTTVRVRPFDPESFADRGDVPIPDDAEELVVHLRRATLIRGVLVKPDGSPIDHALIDGYVGGARKHIVETDEFGKFAMKCTDEAVDLKFQGTAYRDGQQTRIPYIGGEKGVRRGTQDVRIRTISLDGNEKLVVRVLGPDGPLQGLHVYIDPGLGFMAAKQTDAEGRVTFEGLAPITRSVRAFGRSADGVPWIEQRVEATPGGEEVTINMKYSALIKGRVLDPAGSPVGGAMLTLRAAGNSSRVLSGGRTREDGTFELAAPPRTRVRLTASQRIDRALFDAELVIDEAPAERVELRLARTTKKDR